MRRLIASILILCAQQAFCAEEEASFRNQRGLGIPRSLVEGGAIGALTSVATIPLEVWKNSVQVGISLSVIPWKRFCTGLMPTTALRVGSNLFFFPTKSAVAES